ncbi:MAG: GNAT family N-acetyltransferase [Candidatus Acidiferrales bacterium]|jgi:GNAT superfamily N-acetyltransferase
MATSAISGGIRVRRATPADIPQLPELCGQLGYPSSEEDVRKRFCGIDAAPDHALFVTETADGRLIGLLHIFVMRTMESEARGEIGGLVVDDAHRSHGVGKRLVEQAEYWAREHGCAVVSLRSNVIRDRAHSFYERLGYKHVKTQKSFRKNLPAI